MARMGYGRAALPRDFRQVTSTKERRLGKAMSLYEIDVLGQGEIDPSTEEVIRPPDPTRSLVRYTADDREVFVAVRMNLALLAAAAEMPILLLQPSSPPDDLFPVGGLTAAGSVRSYELLERVCDDVVARGCPAWYLAEQHGDTGRDFYFATQAVAALDAIARAAADAAGFALTVRQVDLAEAAPTILPTELIGDLGLEPPPATSPRKTRFEFWGAAASLDELRRQLEQRGFQDLGVELALSELRVAKVVPIDGPGFQAVLQEIVPLARSLRCSYRGTETVGGHEQFALTRPLPARYAGGDGSVRGKLRRIFGKTSSSDT
jgi:hypothetical protein